MVVREVYGVGNDYGIATLNMLNNFKTLFTAYSNVTFVERYTVDAENGICRDIYAIEGFDKYYIALQNEAPYNTNIFFLIVTRGNEHTDTYVYIGVGWSAYGKLGANDTPIAISKFYAISKNNVLKAFTLISTEYSVTGQMICFITQNSNNYIIYQDSSNICALTNNIQNDIYYIYSIMPAFNTNEQAIKKNAIIIQSGYDNGLYIDSFDTMYHFINNQFAAMTLALIQVDNNRYRQVYENYIFIEDGDTE